jgi:chromosome segregation ATPase
MVVKLQQTSDDLTAQLAALTQKIEELQGHIGNLEQQLKSGGEERDKIERELADTRKEKDNLLAQWSSLKAVRDRLVQIRDEQRLAEVQRREADQTALDQLLREKGNRGYLIKDGKSTFDPELWDRLRAR